MTDRFTEEETVAAVSRLTRTQLVTFIQAEVVSPILTESGPVFRQIDIVRLELLCELSEQFDLEADALGVVMSLIDQLHEVRAELRAVLEALGREPNEVRARIAEALRQTRPGP